MANWNPPADLTYAAKRDVLAAYFHEYGFTRVVETGLYNGQGSSYQFIGQATVVVCDLRQEWCDQANREGVSLAVCGDTRDTFEGVLRFLTGPALFWLDSHLVVEAEEENDSPLESELAAILPWEHAARSVVLIDDVRMFGRSNWPVIEDVVLMCEPMWDVTVKDDIVRCVPRG